MSAFLRVRSILVPRISLSDSFNNNLSHCCRNAHRLVTQRTNSFSTSVVYAIEKRALNKKITIPKDPYLLSEKVIKFANTGKLRDAITLVMESPNSRQNEVVWNNLIQESSKLGKTAQSWQLLNDMKKRGFEPSERTYTILLNALAINSSSPKSVSRAKELYRQMQESEDTPPTLVHTNALLKVCGHKPDYVALMHVFSDMPKTGPNAPNVVTYNTVIGSFARMGTDEGFQLAWEVWQDVLVAKTRRPDEVVLDSQVVDSILLACRGARNPLYIQRGYALFESLYGISPPTAQSGSVPSGSSSGAGSPSKMLGLGAALRKDTIEPRTVELLLSICTKLKDYKKGQKYLELIKTAYPDFKPDVQLLSSIMHLQLASKEPEEALKTWDEVSRLGLQEHTPWTLRHGLDAAWKTRNWNRTLEMYEEMTRLVKQNQDLDTARYRPMTPVVQQQDTWTLSCILKCAVKTKHIEEGLAIIRREKWIQAVQTSKYPRASAETASYAVKIFKKAIRLRQDRINGGLLEEDEKEKLTAEVSHLRKELQDAQAAELRAAEALGAFEKSKSECETDERAAQSGSWKWKDTKFGEKEGNEEQEHTTGVGGSGWRKVTPTEYVQTSGRMGHSRVNTGGSPSKARVRPARKQGVRAVDDAFRPKSRFTRGSLE
ncbi:hypothetical protein BG004_004107 [Podila humilis]|nr:hypothetical protein BG004_004107 [Podila humilis]